MIEITDYDKLNSMTKYPSILTYHMLGDKGKLLPELNFHIDPTTDVYVTEKINGTNTRMVFVIDDETGDDYFIGSREELLSARGDRIYNPQLDIVKSLKCVCESAMEEFSCSCVPGGIYTVYSELYGGKIDGAKQYTKIGKYGAAVFDISYIPTAKYNELMALSRAQIAAWRDHGGQTFLKPDHVSEFCDAMIRLAQVPYVACIKGKELPETIEEAYQFLQAYKDTKAGMDISGHAEGVVIRNVDRSIIAKLRFEDYEKTLNLNTKKKKGE